MIKQIITDMTLPVSLQKAESYRSMMNMSSEQAASFTQKLDQELVEWMKTKPLPGHSTGKMSADSINHILNHKPELARSYVNDFLKEHENAIMEKITHIPFLQMNHIFLPSK